MIKAILFDMDGVLSNSEPHHIKGLKEVFRRHGKNITNKDLNDIFGKIDEQIIKDICKKKKFSGDIYALGREKREIVVEIMKKSKIPIFPGAKNLVKTLSKLYKLGIGTSSSHPELDVVLGKISLRKYFKEIMGREDVRTHKPSPELYRKLAKRLGAKPSECIVIEDSVTGVEAANRAKIKCIAVTHTFPASKLKNADIIVNNLREIQKLLC